MKEHIHCVMDFNGNLPIFKALLTAMLAVNSTHLLPGKNGNVLNSMFFLLARLMGTAS